MRFERVKKEVEEEILEKIYEQYLIPKEAFKDYVFLMAGKHKVFIMHKKNISKAVLRGLDRVFLKSFRVGLLLGEIDKRGFRFSIDGSQIFGKLAKKNVYEMSEEEVEDWVRGLDLTLENPKEKGLEVGKFVIMKHKNDFYGSGLVLRNRIKNLIPKIRRIKKFSEY